MIQATLPLIVTMALGAIVGITVTHFQQVELMVEQSNKTSPTTIDTPANDVPSVSPQKRLMVTDTSRTQELSAYNNRPIADSVLSAGSNPREDALLKLLAEQTKMLSTMRMEQKALRKQVSETNRDMDELTFRVDSHSDDFRPLRVDSPRPRQLIDISPEAPDAGQAGGLLPPKQ